MISLKSPREIDAMEKAGAALAAMHLGFVKLLSRASQVGRLKNSLGSTSRLLELKLNKLALKDTSMLPVLV